MVILKCRGLEDDASCGALHPSEVTLGGRCRNCGALVDSIPDTDVDHPTHRR